MKRLIAPAAAVLFVWATLATAAVFGAQPVIQAPAEPVPLNLVLGLPVTGEADFRAAVIEEGARVLRGILADGTPAIWFKASQVGRYTVVATGPEEIVDGYITWERGKAIVQVGDEPPPPPPPTKAVYLWLIHESGDSTPETTKVRDDPTWEKAAEKAGLNWMEADDDELAKLEPDIVEAARKHGLPVMVVLDKDKAIIEIVAMPNVQGICDLVSKYAPKAPPVKRQPAARAPHR